MESCAPEAKTRSIDMSGLAGKVAIVTGAGSGIGQGIAIRLAHEGARVIVDYIGGSEGAEETLREIRTESGDAAIVLADVTRSNDIRKLVDEAWNRFGSADILVNNAGIEHKADFWDTAEANYDNVMAVNLRGPFFLTQEFVRRLRSAQRPGRIINISSVHEDMAFPGFYILLQQGRNAHDDAQPCRGAWASWNHGQQCRARRHCNTHQ
jgi:glucose 1-dehydrogenase